MNFRQLNLILCLFVASPFLAVAQQGPACKATHCNELLEKGRIALLQSLKMRNNTQEFDQAQDFLEEAYITAKKYLTSFETMISLQYLLILSAIEVSRKGLNNKYRADALDRLEVARDELVKNLDLLHAQTDSITHHKQIIRILKTLNLMMQVSIALGNQEKNYNKAKLYFAIAQEAAQLTYNER
jgi:hypothetical protein